MRRCLVLIIALALIVAACTTAPVTGRRQFNIIPSGQALQLGSQAYQQIKASTPVARQSERQQLIERIGFDIVRVAEAPPEFEWEFTLFEDPTPNAFALPGGKVGVHTGLFDVVENEDQLATVMAHEVGHAIADHGSERMSRALAMQVGLAVAGAATESAEAVNLLAGLAQLGVELPYTRSQEAEADHIGLIYMARAGYDPSEADDLWMNFARLGGERPPEFLSTHPHPENRIKAIRELLPRACNIYFERTGRRCKDQG